MVQLFTRHTMPPGLSHTEVWVYVSIVKSALMEQYMLCARYSSDRLRGARWVALLTGRLLPDLTNDS